MSTEILKNDYKALLDFIYGGRSWKQVQRSRLQPHTDHRHIIRVLILEGRKPTLEEVAEAEAMVIGKTVPDHSTISNSQKKFNADLKTRYCSTINQLNAFYKRMLQDDLAGKKYEMRLVFIGAPPSDSFLKRLDELIETENKAQSNG